MQRELAIVAGSRGVASAGDRIITAPANGRPPSDSMTRPLSEAWPGTGVALAVFVAVESPPGTWSTRKRTRRPLITNRRPTSLVSCGARVACAMPTKRSGTWQNRNSPVGPLAVSHVPCVRRNFSDTNDWMCAQRSDTWAPATGASVSASRTRPMISDGPPCAEVSAGALPQARRTIVGADGVAKASDRVESAATSSGGNAILIPSESRIG